MGNANTEKNKLAKRKTRAREFLKTRAWKKDFADLAPLDPEEVLLVSDLRFPGGKGFRAAYEFGWTYVNGERVRTK